MILQSDIKNKLQGILPKVMKPGRYVGNELYSVHKVWQKAAVRFALSHPAVSCVLVGVKRPSQIEDHVHSASIGPLNDEAINRIRQLWKTYIS